MTSLTIHGFIQIYYLIGKYKYLGYSLSRTLDFQHNCAAAPL
jgi:hypothetical protein